MSFESVMPPYNASDPTATFLSSSCLDFLLIELVPMTYRVANELEAQALDALPGPPPAPAVQVVPPPGEPASHPPPVQTGAAAAASAAGPTPSGPAGARAGRKMDEEEERDAVFYRLDTLGYRVGQGLVERLVPLPPCAPVCPYPRAGRFAAPTITMAAPLLTPFVRREQLLARPAAVQRHARRHQVPLQGLMDAGLSETGGQPKDKPQGMRRSTALSTSGGEGC